MISANDHPAALTTIVDITRAGGRQWLERSIVASIADYVEFHGVARAEQPERLEEITAQLGQALKAKLDYAVWLTDHTLEPRVDHAGLEAG